MAKTQILIMKDGKVTTQQYAPQVKGINESFSCPKDNEVIDVDNCRIRRASDMDINIINRLEDNPTAQIVYFNSK